MGDLLDRVAKLQPDPFTYEVREVASPSVGQDWSITCNDGGVWRVRAIVATLATSAVVANRAPHLQIDNQTDTSMIFPVGAVQAASLTVTYAWLLGFPVTMAAAEAGLVVVPTVEHVLHQGWRVRPITANLDAGDTWSKITFTIDRVRTPPRTIAQRLVDTVDAQETILETLEAEGYG